MSGYRWGAGMISGLLLVACGGAHDATDTSGGDDAPNAASDEASTAGDSDASAPFAAPDASSPTDTDSSETDADSTPDAPVDAGASADEATAGSDEAAAPTDEAPSSSTPAPGGVGHCKRDADCDDGFDCTDDRCSEVLTENLESTGDRRCVHLADSSSCGVGAFCLPNLGCVESRACATDDECRDDDACTVQERCDAASRTCLFELLDGDRDGHPAPVCGGYDCDDSSADIGPDGREWCNGIDDDCDGEIDEQGELQDDAFNCGACGVVCPEGSGCDAGRCVECGGADVAGCPPAPTVPPPASSEPPSSTPPVTPPSELPTLCPPGCTAGSPCLARLPVTYRDFSSEHVDFGPLDDGCTRSVEDTGEVVAAESLSVGLVRAALPTAGVPELAESPALQQCLPDATVGSYEAFSAFDEWFTDGAGRARYQRELLLFRTDDGGFANRLNDDGEQWFGYENETYGEPRDFVCSWCLDGSCNDPCQGDETFYDGSPVFFPLDDVGTEAPLPARIAADYGYLAEPWEEDVLERSVRHNHFFTSVVTLEHVHAAGDDIRIDLLASDDLWVFVNGTLAADLGGRHVPEAASIALNDTSAATYGLSPGVSYDVLVFAANRSCDNSTFFLKVTGIDDLGEPVAACEP